MSISRPFIAHLDDPPASVAGLLVRLEDTPAPERLRSTTVNEARTGDNRVSMLGNIETDQASVNRFGEDRWRKKPQTRQSGKTRPSWGSARCIKILGSTLNTDRVR